MNITPRRKIPSFMPTRAILETSMEEAWRPSTREEIFQYYDELFPTAVETGMLPEWTAPPGPIEFAIAFRRRFPAINGGDRDNVPWKDFVRRSTRSESGSIFIEGWDEMLPMIQDPAGNDTLRRGTDGYRGLAEPDAVPVNRPRPQAVYYSLDHHERFWLFAFDLDAKMMAKSRIAEQESSDVHASDVDEELLVEHGVFESAPGRVDMPASAVPGATAKGRWPRNAKKTTVDQSDGSGNGHMIEDDGRVEFVVTAYT